ncbi:hypothetical protein DDE82_006592 [Stemphylium lycopersici]|uniref:Uncharacterized protein n=1 Tax=Stemphylium lycopersici TaxID=183478 RepID=A0A364MS67_STELY|nr:hypothetical protein TW65_99373 [Stemphylium lycopersici]RAR01379.1 hypothetical protein DDE82_006592 [Stemphylium lycopersici]RAR01586.1 hypothetical protein DDE83_008861 [Stemphylium lycopersici]
MYFPITTAAASVLLTILLTSTPAYSSAIPTSPQLSRGLDAIPMTIYSGPTCAQSIYTTTAYIPADGTCFSPSPIFDSNTNSFKIDPANLAKLPKGCSLEVYQDRTCSGGNKKLYSKVTGKCDTFGAYLPVGSAKAVGTC